MLRIDRCRRCGKDDLMLNGMSMCQSCRTYYEELHKKLNTNEECAVMFVNAIKELATKQDNLDNLENYLSNHFDVWMENFANSPSGLASELKEFAEMEI